MGSGWSAGGLSAAIKGQGDSSGGWGNVSSPLWAAAPLHPAGLVLGAGSEHGGVERRAASSCLGRGLPTASMPRGGSSRLTSRRNRLNCRTWASSLPWSSLVLTAQQPLEWSAQSHSTGRISAEAPRQGASSQVPRSGEQQGFVREAPLPACVGQVLMGPGDSRELERLPSQGGGLVQEAVSCMSMSSQGVEHSPGSWHGIPKDLVAGASRRLWLTLLGGAAAPWGFGPGLGAWRGGRRGTVRLLCSAANSLTRDSLFRGPQGLVHSSH